MNECLVYQIKPGRTGVGRHDSENTAAIRLSGESILDEHCVFENADGVVTLQIPTGSITVRASRAARLDIFSSFL